MFSNHSYMPYSPYKGLIPYSETDSLFFFGRDDWRRNLIDNLQASRLTILYGSSGIGKTSVLSAGVAYYLRQAAKENLQKYHNLRQAVIIYPPRESSWSDNAIDGIKNQIKTEIASLLNISLHELESRFNQILLSQPDSSFPQILKNWTKFIGKKDNNDNNNVDGKLFIILDRFEAYLFDNDRRNNKDFASELIAAINKSDLNVNLLISLREDAISALDAEFKGKIPNLLTNRLQIKHLDENSARDAIKKPVAEYNRQAIILENFLNSKLTVLYGDSNTHKTSLLREGIFQYLKQAGLSVKILDCWYDKQELKELLINSNNQFNERDNFVIIDQFEELFWCQGKEIVENLLLKIKNTPENVHWLISLHEDGMSDLKTWQDLIPCQFYLHLSQEQVFEEQVKEQTVTLKENFNIKSDLVDAVLKALTANNSEIETFLLQLIMSEIWEEDVIKSDHLILRKQTFEKLGNIETIVKNYLWSKLGDPLETQPTVETLLHNQQTGFPLLYPQKDIAASIFHHLVTPGGYKIAHTVSDLRSFANEYRDRQDLELLQEKQIKDLLDKLDPVRIIRHLPGDRYEIFHDVLAKPILEWQSLFINQQLYKQAIKNADKQAIKTLMEDYGKEYFVSKLIHASYTLRDKELARQDEVMALLARQAYLFNQQYSTGMLDEVDEALRKVMNRSHFSPILCGHGNEVSSVTFTPNSQLFASGSFDGTVKLWDLKQRKCIKTISTGVNPRKFDDRFVIIAKGGILSIAISPDGEKLAVGCGDSTVRVFNLNQPTTDPIILKGHTDEVWSVTFSSDGKLLASGSWDKTVRLWDLEQPPEKAEICRKYHRDYIWSVAFSPDGNTVAAGCRNGTIWLRSLNDSKKLKLTKMLSVNRKNSRQLKKDELINDDEIFSVAFNNDGTMLAAGSGDGKVRLWDLTKDTSEPTVLPGWEDMRRSIVAFSFDGQWLASGSDNGIVKLWKLEKLEKLEKITSNPLVIGQQKSLNAHYKGVSSVAFGQNGKWLGSGSWDWTARLWDLQRSETEPIVLEKHQDRITAIAFSPDSKKLASGSYDRTLLLWDLDSPNSLPLLLNNDDGNVNAVAFSGDGKKLASGAADGKIRLWDLDQSDKTPKILERHEGEISALAFSPHNPNILASGSWNHTVNIWDLSSFKIIKTLEKHDSKISAVAFSPNDNILATSSDDCTVRLWHLNQPDTLSISLPKFDHKITSLAFNKTIYLDNYGYAQLLAISTDDNKIQVWDVTPFQKHPQAEPIFLSEYSSFEDQKFKGSPVVFSPDGYILASGSHDNKVLLWDLHQPNVEPVALEGHRDKITTLTFSPDGKWIAAGSLDKTIRLWLAKTETIANIVCDKVWRNLTWDEWEKYVSKEIPYQCTCPNLPQGKGVSSSERGDVLQREFAHKIGKLMAHQKEILQLIEDQKEDLSEEEIAKKLKKPQLEEFDFIGLESLCRLKFLSKKSPPQWGTIPSYCLSDRYRQYLSIK